MTISCQTRRTVCAGPVENTVCFTTLRIHGSASVCLASSTGVLDSVVVSVPELIKE